MEKYYTPFWLNRGTIGDSPYQGDYEYYYKSLISSGIIKQMSRQASAKITCVETCEETFTASSCYRQLIHMGSLDRYYTLEKDNTTRSLCNFQINQKSGQFCFMLC